MRGLKSQETTYKMQKEEDKKREVDLLNAKQNEMSNVLIELDVRSIVKGWSYNIIIEKTIGTSAKARGSQETGVTI